MKLINVIFLGKIIENPPRVSRIDIKSPSQVSKVTLSSPLQIFSPEKSQEPHVTH